jgi:uncharacterized protein with ParB-like and HNH nuclease domain
VSINPNDQRIMEVFSSNKQYYIDFYQRDYQWKTEHVEKLLEDLFYRFSLEYKPTIDITEEALSQFNWYYLNAYVTNDYKGKTFIVDGQQRLTSLTLILIKLYHLAEKFGLSDRKDLTKQLIFGVGVSGHTYWMGHGNRRKVLEDLVKHGKQTVEDFNDDVSFKNLYKNYEAISKQLDTFLSSQHKYEAFLIYFLTRVMLVRIHIEATEDVPMVFEVINDRGEGLKPYEVLKGKLLGQIAKEEIDTYHDIWQEYIHKIQGIDESEVDNFFRFYFRSQYVDSRAEYREFDGDYHKAIYESKWNERIGLKRNTVRTKDFIRRDLVYYAKLYLKILLASKELTPKVSPHLFYNELNDQDRQFLLILSACELDYEFPAEKIALVARLFDKHFTLLQLTGSYDSNRFTESLVKLNKSIRRKSCDEIEKIYNQQIIDDVSDAKGVQVQTPSEWAFFKDSGYANLGVRFLRYYFARIEHFLAEQCSRTPENYYNLVRNTGYVNGYHIEHILANNEENKALFNDDEELFYTERNLLGGLLMLKGRDNQSSGNETYSEKLKTYSGTLIWNQTLRSDFYHSNKDFQDFASRFNLNFKSYDDGFDGTAIVERQKLLFELTKLIWE